MRLVPTFFVLLLFTPLMGFGQLQLGARGGYSISSVSFIPDKDQIPIYNGLYDAGIILKYYDLTYFGFQAEANYTQRGYRYPIVEDIFNKRVNSYLEFPIYMQIRYKHNNLFAHINAGVYLSFLIRAEEGIENLQKE